MEVKEFLICSNEFNFSINCNNIDVDSFNFINFYLGDKRVFQCSYDIFYLKFYKISEHGIACYELVRRENFETINSLLNDSSAFEQEEIDKIKYEEKQNNTEDFVGFEERLKFFGKMTREYLLKLINQYFPNCETHLKRYGRIEVTTVSGTFFTLVPKKYKGNNIPDYEYEISFAIF